MSARRRRAVLVAVAIFGCAVGVAAQQPSSSPPPATVEATPAIPPDGDEPAEAPPEPETLSPRTRYNRGLRSFTDGEHEQAAELFLAARDEAGTDRELRFRAAFNLGLALAAQADAATEEAPQRAIDTLRQAAAWFRDSVRLRPEDEDARINLEVVLRRIQVLADQLNQGANRLEARLDRLIDDQRGLRDRVRTLLGRIEEAGAGAEPTGFTDEFEVLATSERTLQADAGVVSDLAAEELALIESMGEEERGEQDRIRQVQLTNLDLYLQQARQSLSDSRRLLRRLEGDRAQRRAGAALEELKRAREQLLDPIAVMKGMVEDETVLAMHTQALAGFRQGRVRIDAAAEPAAAPPWLVGELLAEQQLQVIARGQELLERLRAGVTNAADGASSAAEVSPEDERFLTAVGEAIPHVEAADLAMQAASNLLPAEDLAGALRRESEALTELLRAIERFAGVRQLIELAHADQSTSVALLTPPGEQGAPAEELSTEERTDRLREATARNQERMTRLEALLAEERATKEQGAAPQAAPGQAAPDSEAAAQQAEAVRERYERAEELRELAVEELARLAQAIEQSPGSARTPAVAASTHIEDLRRLFFSIVEHLEELHRNQTQTHDETASATESEGAEDRLFTLGPLTERQARHRDLGGALTEALAAQAAAAAAESDPQAGAGGDALVEATGEVRSATGQMHDAADLLAEASVDDGYAMSYDLGPTLEHQQLAMEHLENAIRLLKPHSDQPQQQQQQQQQPQAGEEEQQVTQRQAERRLQAIRDREAERQRRRERQQASSEPVEKDW